MATLLKVPPMFFLVPANRLLIILGNQFRFFGSQVITYHHRAALTLHLMGIRSHGTLQQGKTLMPQMYHSRFYHQMIREKYRHKEVCIDIGYHNSQLAPVGTA